MLRLALLSAIVASSTEAQPPAAGLKLGDMAPPLAVSGWLKGGPIAGFEPGKTYVVELGATWSPAMGESAIVLTDLQKRFADRGVTVIGVFVRENRREDAARWVRERESAFGYAVAADEVPVPSDQPDDRLWAMEQGRMSAGWLKAMGRDKLPAAFIVDSAGRLAWAGSSVYPRGELEEALNRALAGTLTPEDAASLSASYLEREKKIERATTRWRQALTQRDYKLALELMDELIGLAPARMLSDADFVGRKLMIMLVEARDEPGAYAFARKLAAEDARENAAVLHAMSWVILDTRGLAKRDLDFALELARRADDLTGHRVPRVLDTLARAHFERNELSEAVAAQSTAVEQQRVGVAAATPAARRAAEAVLAQLETTLKRYQDDLSRRGGGARGGGG